MQCTSFVATRSPYCHLFGQMLQNTPLLQHNLWWCKWRQVTIGSKSSSVFVPLLFCISHYFYMFATIIMTFIFVFIIFLVIMFIAYFNYMLSIVRLSSYSCISSYSACSKVHGVSGRHCVSWCLYIVYLQIHPIF